MDRLDFKPFNLKSVPKLNGLIIRIFIGVFCTAAVCLVLLLVFIHSAKEEVCPRSIISISSESTNFGNDLWAYATLWSVRVESANSHEIRKILPHSVLNRLNATFKTLSLQAYDDLPAHCRQMFPKWEQFRAAIADNGKQSEAIFINYSTDRMAIEATFTSDLPSEFQFSDRLTGAVTQIQNYIEYDAFGKGVMYDTLVAVYISPTTPELEKNLPKEDFDLVKAQKNAILSAMNNYRSTSTPYFVLLGSPKDLLVIDDNDAQNKDMANMDYLPEDMALAFISQQNDVIFNHGMVPAFGAVLARAKVVSYALPENVLHAAKNASLNWKTSVVY